LQDLVDNNNNNRAKSAKDLLTFSLPAFLLPVYLPWATLPSTILQSMLPPNIFKKRLNKAHLSFVFKKQAEKAVDIFSLAKVFRQIRGLAPPQKKSRI